MCIESQPTTTTEETKASEFTLTCPYCGEETVTVDVRMTDFYEQPFDLLQLGCCDEVNCSDLSDKLEEMRESLKQWDQPLSMLDMMRRMRVERCMSTEE